MTLPQIRLDVGADGTATLSWDRPSPDPAALQAALTALADDALANTGLRRLEVALPASDLLGRRAVLRSGFRVEGVRRDVLPLADGTREDLVVYARLASDQVGGGLGFSAVMNSALPRKRLIAHVLMRDAEDRILLCETHFKADWELPGGIVEPYEPPRLGAVREVREELGIDCPVGPLLVVDWMPPYLGWEDAIEMIFDGGWLTPADVAGFVLQPTEIRRVELVRLDQAAAVVTPLAHRRLRVALALRPGETAYLEDGVRVG